MNRIVLFALLIGTSLPAVASEWRSTEGSEFTFEVAFEGAPLSGYFREFNVVLKCDAACPESGSLRVTVNLKAADMGDPDMNEVLLDPAWLAVEQFTEAIFCSDSIARQAPGEFVATGSLNLKGTVKDIAVPFAWASSGVQATMQGKFVLQRTDFDVGSGEWATDASIGTAVALRFAVQLLRKE